MYSFDDICVYIFNWKKVTANSLALYEKIRPIIKDTWIINCDEFTPLDDTIQHIQLDDSHYYGSQYNHAIKHVRDNRIFCVIVGDNIADNNFNKIFQATLDTFNHHHVGVYSPHDKRSPHQSRNSHYKDELFDVENTDCGFWFIHPTILAIMKLIDYSTSKYGWGIDIFTIREAKKQGFLVIRDYSIETDQLDYTCGYNCDEALVGLNILENEYNKLFIEKISIIIPTFNRFDLLLNTIQSIKSQTYKNIEIIVVNDCSTQKEYYDYNWKEHGVIMIHLEANTKTIFGYACSAYVRNKGIEISTGTYVAFCDDDDIWFASKLELQMHAMKETGCKISSTDGLIGYGIYDNKKQYQKYNAEHYYNTLQRIFREKGSNLIENGFPRVWNLDFLKIHNCIITSSVLIKKDILNIINNMKCIDNIEHEDYDCWLRALEHTNCVYVSDICFYYDLAHGHGRQY